MGEHRVGNEWRENTRFSRIPRILQNLLFHFKVNSVSFQKMPEFFEVMLKVMRPGTTVFPLGTTPKILLQLSSPSHSLRKLQLSLIRYASEGPTARRWQNLATISRD